MGVVLTADGVAEALVPMGVGALRESHGYYGPGFALLVGLAAVGALAVAALPRTLLRPLQPAISPPPTRHRLGRVQLRRIGLVALAAGAALAILRAAPAAQGPRGLPTIVVTNGDAAVTEAVVAVALPAAMVGESFIVRGEDDGEAVVAQLMRDRTLAFTVRELAPREVRRLRLEPALDRAIGRTRRGARALRRRRPLDRRPARRRLPDAAGPPSPATAGPPSDAAATCTRCGRRRGASSPTTTCRDSRISAACGRRGAPRASRGARPDFWRVGRGTGAVEFEGVLEAWSGPVVAGFRARHRAVNRTVRPPLTAETETWEVTLPALGRVGPRHHVVDLTILHEVVLARPIVVAAAAYGGLGLRAPRAWSGTTGMAVVTSEGRTRRNASRSRARWVAMVGLVGGANAGVAILDHPDNLRHPQPLFVDGGQPFVSYAAMQSGPITLTIDHDLVQHYRIVTFDGFPDRAWLERLWQAYAHPPRADFATP